MARCASASTSPAEPVSVTSQGVQAVAICSTTAMRDALSSSPTTGPLTGRGGTANPGSTTRSRVDTGREKKSRLLEFNRNEKHKTLSARVEPLSWASGIACPEAVMSIKVALEGAMARIGFRMHYTGKNQSSVHDQEMPAVFVDAALANLVYAENGKLKRRVPGLAERARQGSGKLAGLPR